MSSDPMPGDPITSDPMNSDAMRNPRRERAAGRVPDTSSEKRLLAIRREAETKGKIDALGARPSEAPFPHASPQTGYYGIPLLKEPQWKWEVPLYFFVGGADWAPVRVLGNISETISAALGLPFHNYTGVLIGATAIPVWNENVKTLPIHFGMSGVSTSVAILELLGHRNQALNMLGIGATAIETWEGFYLESTAKPALKPLKRGLSGWITRAGGVLSGPIPLVLRVVGALGNSHKIRRTAAWSSIVGSLLTRYGWMQAGRASARDWRLPLEIPEESPLRSELQSKPKAAQMRGVGCES